MASAAARRRASPLSRQRARLERAARLVEAAPQLGRRRRCARRRPKRGAGLARDARAHALGRARTARRRRRPAAARTGSGRCRRDEPAGASSRSAACERLLGGGARARAAASSTSAPTRSRSPNGSSRRASSAPVELAGHQRADRTSPARRRSVSSATRRRSSSSATMVTAWCSVRRSNSVSGPPSLAATSQRLRAAGRRRPRGVACAPRTGSASARPASAPPGA